MNLLCKYAARSNRYLQLLLLFMISITASIAAGITDSLAILDQYKLLRTEYADFERGHGHYINTPNVKMHYLTWGSSKGKPIVWVNGTYSSYYDLFDTGVTLTRN